MEIVKRALQRLHLDAPMDPLSACPLEAPTPVISLCEPTCVSAHPAELQLAFLYGQRPSFSH